MKASLLGSPGTLKPNVYERLTRRAGVWVSAVVASAHGETGGAACRGGSSSALGRAGAGAGLLGGAGAGFFAAAGRLPLAVLVGAAGAGPAGCAAGATGVAAGAGSLARWAGTARGVLRRGSELRLAGECRSGGVRGRESEHVR